MGQCTEAGDGILNRPTDFICRYPFAGGHRDPSQRQDIPSEPERIPRSIRWAHHSPDTDTTRDAAGDPEALSR